MSLFSVYVNGIGIVAPGFDGWAQTKLILTGHTPYAASARPKPTAQLLSATEKRRASPLVHLAISAAQQAITEADWAFSDAASVFASSGGDGETIDAICLALATTEREVSPTRFHNSVHNAPAGYWCIGAKSHQASTSLSSYDATFAAGLLESILQIQSDGSAVLLAAYDHCYPQPLYQSRPLHADFAVALALGNTRTPRSVAALEVAVINMPAPDTALDDPALEILRCGNPAARALPLLASLARQQSASICLGLPPGNHLALRITPC